MTKKTLEEKLAERTVRGTEGECWEWLGALAGNGSPKIYHEGKQLSAHRLIYEHETHSTVEKDRRMVPNCGGDTPCVNPDHWDILSPSEWATHAAEASAQKRAKITHCPKGHEYTPENTRKRGNARKCKTCEVGHSLRSRERATLREMGALEEAEELASEAEEAAKRRAMLEADPYTLMSDRDLASAIRQSKVGAYESACDRHAQEIDWVLDSLEAQGVMVTTNKELEGVALEILDAIAESGTTPTEELSARRLYWDLRKSQDDATLQIEVEQRYSAELKDMKYRMFDEGSDQELNEVEFRREAALLTVKAIAEAELIEQNRSE